MRKRKGSGLHLKYIRDAYVSKHMINRVFLDLLKMSGYREMKDMGIASERACGNVYTGFPNICLKNN